jgi:phosphoglycerate dehydrogenase-like enzyme
MFKAFSQVWSKMITKTNGQTIENHRLIQQFQNQRHRQFVVIGMGRFGSSVAETLDKFGHDVLAIDSYQERVQHLST